MRIPFGCSTFDRAPPSSRSSSAPALSSALRPLWQAVVKVLRPAYRPERHYMRGPGPKWREKHAGADHFRRR